jgi:hypothetical protein
VTNFFGPAYISDKCSSVPRIHHLKRIVNAVLQNSTSAVQSTVQGLAPNPLVVLEILPVPELAMS